MSRQMATKLVASRLAVFLLRRCRSSGRRSSVRLRRTGSGLGGGFWSQGLREVAGTPRNGGQIPLGFGPRIIGRPLGERAANGDRYRNERQGAVVGLEADFVAAARRFVGRRDIHGQAIGQRTSPPAALWRDDSQHSLKQPNLQNSQTPILSLSITPYQSQLFAESVTWKTATTALVVPTRFARSHRIAVA